MTYCFFVFSFFCGLFCVNLFYNELVVMGLWLCCAKSSSCSYGNTAKMTIFESY